ncbi:MAG: tetratricopeptide repeat protein [Candidatus Omnitrophota bacterium]
MRKFLFCLIAVVLLGSFCPLPATAYNYGDLKSSTLTSKAWQALGENDIEAALNYSMKCFELYSDKAKEMQSSLSAYPQGSKSDVFNYWALNDVATCLFIQGEAYLKSEMPEEAIEVFLKLIKDYSYGQCWDPQGWFWKPAEAAQEKIEMLKSGKLKSSADLGDTSSSALTAKAWKALSDNDLKSVEAYAGKCIGLYGNKAREMQGSLTMAPWESNKVIHSYGLLNDVGTCLFILGEAYSKAGRTAEAKTVFTKLVEEFPFAQCWDPQGWFWKPAEAAEQRIGLLE